MQNDEKPKPVIKHAQNIFLFISSSAIYYDF